MLNLTYDYYYYNTIFDELVGNDLLLFPPNHQYSFTYDFFTTYKLVITIENAVTYAFKPAII